MKTKPISLLDFLLWPLLMIFWEPFSQKKSHFWHWCDYSTNKERILNSKLHVTAEKDEKAKPADNFWSNFWQRNFGWQKIAVLVVFQEIKDLENEIDNKLSLAKGFRIGYIAENGVCELCSIVLYKPTAVLIGPEDCVFFAVDLEGNLLRCRIHTYEEKGPRFWNEDEHVRKAKII